MRYKILLVTGFVAVGQALGQSNIDPTNKFGWGESIGWTNWRDADGTNAGVVVGGTFMSGFIWCENVGFINVGDGTPANGISYANVDGSDSGVNIDYNGITHDGCGETLTPGGDGRTSYTLRVQTGCNEVCAYCIIPSTRGAGRSTSLGRVRREVDRIVSEGFKEAALTGVHIGSYGRDLDPPATLLELLRMLDDHPSALMFRLSSLEPMDCSEEIVDLIARSGRFAPHLHLPLQNASDRLLRAMRRPSRS